MILLSYILYDIIKILNYNLCNITYVIFQYLYTNFFIKKINIKILGYYQMFKNNIIID